MAIQITETFPLFHDLEGDPLAAGRVFIGKPNLDAEAHPKEVFFDAAMTIAASQPIRTNAGRLVNGSGQIARIYTDGDFSIIAKDAGLVTVFSSENGQTENDSAISSLKATAGRIITGGGFDNVTDLLASTVTYGANTITRNGESVTLDVSAGDVWTVKGMSPYKVAPANTPVVNGYPLVTAGGVKLFVEKQPNGSVPVEAFGDVSIVNFNKALRNFKNITIMGGEYALNGELFATLGQTISGEAGGAVHITSTSDKFVLTYAVPENSLRFASSSRLTDISITAKNTIRSNPVGTTEPALFAQRGFIMDGCVLKGTYDINADPLAGNETLFPTEAELEALGVGLRSTKIYGLKMTNCVIEGFGIGHMSIGDVAGQDSVSRIKANAVNIWRRSAGFNGQTPQGTDYTFGPALDVLASGRMGSITILGTRDDNVSQCYFENKDETTPSMLWHIKDAQGTKLRDNHLNPAAKTGSTHKFARFDGDYMTQMGDNRIQDHNVDIKYSVEFAGAINFNYGAVRMFLGENGLFPAIDEPHVVHGQHDPSRMSYNNMPSVVRYFSGTITDNNQMFALSANTGNMILKKTNLSGDAVVNCKFDLTAINHIGCNTIEITLNGGYGNGFLKIEDSAGNALWSGNGLQGYGSTAGSNKIYANLNVDDVGSETFTFTLGTNNTEWSEISVRFAYRKYGTTAQRPSARSVGRSASYLDETLGKMIISDGSAWKDTSGASV